MLRARHARAARAIVAALALACTLTAVACGGDDGDDDSAAMPSGTAEAPIGTTAAPSGTTEPATGTTAAPSGTTTAPIGTAADSTAAESTEPPPTEKVTIALDWTANVNYLGIYAAIANGYFEQQGIEPEILPYAGTPAEALIDAGQTDLAISYPPDVIINRAQGLQYKAVAGLVAQNTTALAVLASSKYQSPKDLNGTLYGGFGIQSDKALIPAILKADGVADPKFEEVVLNTAVIDALAKDRIAYSAVFTGIDDVTAELQGVKLRLFPYRDYLGAAGDYPNAVYVASDETIAERGDALKRAMAALAEGYEWSAANPEEAAKILVDQNETELSKQVEIVDKTAAATAPLFLDPSGVWGPLQDEDFAGLTQILVDGGVLKDAPPAPGDLYTDELLPSSR